VSSYIGGIIGTVNAGNGNSEIVRTYNTGVVTVKSQTSTNHAGGIAGTIGIQNTAEFLLKDCYNASLIKSTISVSNRDTYLGGLSGSIYTHQSATGSLKLENNYASGKIEGFSTQAGGLTGQVYAGDLATIRPQIINCLVVLQSIETQGATGRLAGVFNQTCDLSGNYACILGEAGLQTQADSESGADWTAPTPTSWTAPVNSWSQTSWNLSGQGAYLPQIKDLPGQPRISFSFRGEGTERDPYLIRTAEDLQVLATHVNEWSTPYEETYFNLTPQTGNELDLDGFQIYPIGVFISSMSNETENKPFRGIFDGQDKTIKNLTIHGNQLPDDRFRSVALFGLLGEGAIIQNLHLDQIHITARDVHYTDKSYAAAFVGNARNGVTITNCHISQLMLTGGENQSVESCVGGIAGAINTQATLQGCTVNGGTITGGNGKSSRVGGITGSFVVSEPSSLANCNVTGMEISNALYDSDSDSDTGGLSGILNNFADQPVYIQGNQITACTITGGNGTATSRTGGLIGDSFANLIALENCLVTHSSVTGGDAPGPDGDGESVTGGLIGYLLSNGNDTYVRAVNVNCINTTIQGGDAYEYTYSAGLIAAGRLTSLTQSCAKEVNITSGNAPVSCTGGLIGHTSQVRELSECFATGSITTTGTDQEIVYTGGLIGNVQIGENEQAVIRDNYAYVTLLSGAESNTHAVGGLAGRVWSHASNPAGHLKISHNYVAGEIKEKNSPTNILTGGITGNSVRAHIENNLVMLRLFESANASSYRIAGSRTEGVFQHNYAYIADMAQQPLAAHDNQHGADWNGSTSGLPVSNWVKTIWNTDPANQYMPHLKCFADNQPAIPNLLYVAPEPTTYLVYLSSVEGAITHPATGSYVVAEGDSFTFTLTLLEEYTDSYPIVRVNGAIQTADTEAPPVYTYTIRNIQQDTYITMEGITPEIPTSTDSLPESENRIYTQPGHLMVELISPSYLRIYTFNGTQVMYRQVPSGTTSIPLAKGSYIISINHEIYKVIVH